MGGQGSQKWPGPPATKQPRTGGCSTWYPAPLLCKPLPPHQCYPGNRGTPQGGHLPTHWPCSPSRPPSRRLLPQASSHWPPLCLSVKGSSLVGSGSCCPPPTSAHGVRPPGPPRVPELTEGRVPALKPKPKPGILVLQHLHAPPHPPRSEPTPRKPHSVNPATGSLWPWRTCSRHRHSKYAPRQDLLPSPPPLLQVTACFLLCRFGAPASCCDLQEPTGLSQHVPEPGHTDAGHTYLTRATPELAQGTYLWPHSVPESWVRLVCSWLCCVLSRSPLQSQQLLGLVT